LTHREKANLVEKENPDICLARQAKLLHISRSSIYYQPSPVSQEDINLMNLIDEIYTKYPFYGSRRMEKEVRRYHDIICNRKHVRRLMGQMGIEAIYPRQNTSLPDQRNETYKYLLHNLTISCPNQVWGTDITYIKLSHGFAYLVAIMDWFSRYVIAWALSDNLENEFVLSNLNKALETNKPEIQG